MLRCDAGGRINHRIQAPNASGTVRLPYSGAEMAGEGGSVKKAITGVVRTGCHRWRERLAGGERRRSQPTKRPYPICVCERDLLRHRAISNDHAKCHVDRRFRNAARSEDHGDHPRCGSAQVVARIWRGSPSAPGWVRRDGSVRMDRVQEPRWNGNVRSVGTWELVAHLAAECRPRGWGRYLRHAH